MIRANSAISLLPCPLSADLMGGGTRPMVKTADLQLPHVVCADYPMISPAQLSELMRSPSEFGYEELLILDARYLYEYKNGHIQNSVFAGSGELRNTVAGLRGKDVAIVIYSEKSSTRGRIAYNMIRRFDRDANKESYPKVDFTEMYILEGGYQRFFGEFPALCAGGYTRKRDPLYLINGELKRANSETRRRSFRSLEMPKLVQSPSKMSMIFEMSLQSLSSFGASQ